MPCAVRAERSDLPVGYVDQAGLLPAALPTPFVPFPDEQLAESALLAGQLQGYYVLAPDFLVTSRARLVASKPLSAAVQGAFTGQVRQRLLQDLPPQVAERLNAGSSISVQSADGSRHWLFNQFHFPCASAEC